MSTISGNNKRIAKNTLMLYLRHIFIIAIALYTSRVVLNALGIQDYGIYNVVAGVVVMANMLNSAMSVATTRYITFELGKGEKNFERLHTTYCISFTTYIIIAIIFLLFAETVGLWFINTHLVVPTERMVAVNWIYQFACLSLIVNLFTNPFNALIIAHERMDAYAIIGIFEAIIQLVIAFLIYVSPIDKLISYGFLLLLQSLLVCTAYSRFCSRHFDEAHFEWYNDKALLKKLFVYSGWNLFGSIANMLKGQGLNILLNIFFNPSVNAARAIAYQINAAVYRFSSNFFTAVRPQITKYYAEGKNEQMIVLVLRSSKFSFFLLLLLSLPILIEAPYIIRLWLGQLPENVVVFVRFIIAISAIEAIQHPVTTVVHATGNVACFQFWTGLLIIMIIPLSYISLKMGYPPVSVFVISLIINFIALIVRVLLVNRVVKFPIIYYLKYVVCINFAVAVIACIVPCVVYYYIPETFITVILVCFITIISTLVTIYLIGLNNKEKDFVVLQIKKIMRK